MQDQNKMKFVLDKLNNYLNDGFVLHGSKLKIDTLEPRQANDINPDRSHVGKQFAVYAEDKDVRIPIVMALFDFVDKNKSTNYGYSRGPDGIMHVKGENIYFTNGWVNVLPKHTFKILEDKEKGDRELVSFESVKSVDILEVDISILEYLKDIKYDIKG
jgi:hypothetical protein